MWPELDEELEPWRQRALEGDFPYVLVDARYEKARVDHRNVDVAVLVAIGVSAEGHRHVLGVEVVHGETTASWSGFFSGLVERDLRGVQLITSDGHAGLAEARRTHFAGVPWQRCQRHFLMNALEKAPKALEEELHCDCAGSGTSRRAIGGTRGAHRAGRRDGGQASGSCRVARGRRGGYALLLPLSRGAPEAAPDDERVNQELLRRSRVVRIFPNPKSCLRLAIALLKAWHKDWITGRRYLRMEELASSNADPPERMAA